jgi:UDP-N-acetylmuramate-alanine ligase
LAENELKKLSAELEENFKAENISNEVIVGDPRESILQTAATAKADLIVMGSHGRTGLTKLFIGSVSQAIAGHAPCSVAVIRGVVPKGKVGALNQSGLFVATNKEEYDQKYNELTKEMEDLSK